jgi:hypothetical protein
MNRPRLKPQKISSAANQCSVIVMPLYRVCVTGYFYHGLSPGERRRHDQGRHPRAVGGGTVRMRRYNQHPQWPQLHLPPHRASLRIDIPDCRAPRRDARAPAAPRANSAQNPFVPSAHSRARFSWINEAALGTVNRYATEFYQPLSVGNYLFAAGSVFLAADTWIGPFYFAYGHTSGGRSSFYLYLGRP